MGARSNIVIQEHTGNRIWLYGHWLGDDSVGVVARVLGKRQRWNDAPYLARMLFSDMVSTDITGDTGFGISTEMCDNEYPIIVLEPSTQTAWLEDSDWTTSPRGKTPLTRVVTFEQLLAALEDSGTLEELTERIEVGVLA